MPVMGNGGITNGHHPENGHVANGGGGGGKAEKVLLTGYDLKVPGTKGTVPYLNNLNLCCYLKGSLTRDFRFQVFLWICDLIAF